MAHRVRSKHAAILRVRPSALVLLSFLVLLVAHAARLAHPLLVAHVTCEHGELVDAPLHGHESAHDRPAAEVQQGHVTDAGDLDGEGHEHEHCDAAALHHHPGELARAIQPATLLGLLSPPGLDRAPGAAPIAVLTLAPKSSPPRA